MNMISTGAFQTEMDASIKQETLAEKFARVWEKKNSKVARAGGVSLMALTLAACGSDDDSTDTSSDTSTTDTATTTTTPVGTSFSLTDDTNDIEGGAGDDTFTGAIDTMAASDYIVGGAGTDTLTVRMDANDAFGVIEGVENIVIYARGDNGGAATSFVDVSGVTNVTLINGNSNYDLASFDQSVSLKFVNADEDYTVAYDDLSGEADSQSLELDGYEGAFIVGTTGLETLAVTLSGDASDATITDHGTATIETITVAGAVAGELTLAAGTDAVTSISAASATGDVTLDVSGVTLNQDITGGAGADTVVFGSTLTTADEVDTGAGSDEITATMASATTVRPTLAAAELLDLDFTAAATLDLRNATGITAIELEYSAAPTITNAAASVQSISIDEATANTDNLSVDYAASSDSAVTITIAGSDTDANNDVAVSVGDITLTDNAGALTVTSGGEADNSIDAFAADDVASVTLNAATMGLTQTGTFSASGATAASFLATADSLTVADGSTITLTDATSITVTAAGGAASLGSITTDADATATISASGAEANDISIDDLDVDHATTVTLTAAGGADITLDTITLAGIDAATTGAADVDLTIVASAEEDSTVTISDVTETASGTETTIDLITVSGAGTFSFTADDADITVTEIDATSHSGVLTIDMGTNVDSAVDVTIGSGADHGTNQTNTVTTGSAADTIVGGAGDDVITANDGGNDITTGGGEDIIVVGHDGGQTIQDFTAGADGDVIRIDISVTEGDAAGAGSISVSGDGADVADGDAGSLVSVSGATTISTGTDNILVIDGTYASVGAAVDTLEVGGANVLTTDLADTEILMGIYTDGTDTFVISITHAETDDDTDLEAGNAVGEVIATLIGHDDLTEFVDGNFDFIA